MLSDEHFTNYFLDALPQLGVGLAEKYNTPSARWLRMEHTERLADEGAEVWIGDIDEDFERWFLEELGKEDCVELLDVPNDELMEVGNGTGEVRAWVALAGAMRGQEMKLLTYEPIYEWIIGMAVVTWTP